MITLIRRSFNFNPTTIARIACSRNTHSHKLSAIPPGYEPYGVAGEFDRMNGQLYYRQADGRYGWLATEKHTNMNGIIHGGFLMLLADDFLGHEVMRQCKHTKVVTVNLDVKFLAAARVGDWLEGVVDIPKMTRSFAFPRGTIFRHGGDPVLMASGVWKI